MSYRCEDELQIVALFSIFHRKKILVSPKRRVNSPGRIHRIHRVHSHDYNSPTNKAIDLGVMGGGGGKEAAMKRNCSDHPQIDQFSFSTIDPALET